MVIPSSDALAPFHELGRLVENRWRAVDYDEQRLPGIAAVALDELQVPARVDPFLVLREFHAAHPQPEQRDAEGRFSDLPITLYNGTRFYIDLYFWLDGTTEIHQHAFAGAFQVLSGSSLHSRYSFTRDREINPHFLTGHLALGDVEILRQGATRPIIPGPDHIHSLFHLDRPSVTLTIRSHHTPTAAPQYAYLKPSLAIHPFYREPAMLKKVQTVSLLLKMRHPEGAARVTELLADSDFESAFRMLEAATHIVSDHGLPKALGLTTSDDLMRRFTAAARVRHGDLVDLVEPVLEERRRQAEIARRRGAITSEPHRFLMALLLNVEGRAKVIELVGERYPHEDPIETIVDWVEELGSTKELGAEHNVLGISGWDDDHVFVFECLLRGMGEAEIAAEAASRYAPAYAAALGERAPGIGRKICEAPLFRAHLP